MSLFDLDKVILAIGGNIALGKMKNSYGFSKVDLRFEQERLGKVESFNRALQGLESDITFLVSGDVRFDPSIFKKLPEYFDEDVGMVIPRVIPAPPHTLAEMAGSVIWIIHDITLENADRESKYFCGGELQAVKHPLPLQSSEIVNDDEFLCHQVYSSGKRIVYAREVEIVNFMPRNFRQLLKQRVRINFGHLQSKRINGWHSSISIGGFRDIKTSVETLLKFLQLNRKLNFPLFLAIIVETVSIFLARIQLFRGQSFRFWYLNTNEN